jgi:hypothetical protein
LICFYQFSLGGLRYLWCKALRGILCSSHSLINFVSSFILLFTVSTFHTNAEFACSDKIDQSLRNMWFHPDLFLYLFNLKIIHPF